MMCRVPCAITIILGENSPVSGISSFMTAKNLDFNLHSRITVKRFQVFKCDLENGKTFVSQRIFSVKCPVLDLTIFLNSKINRESKLIASAANLPQSRLFLN